MGIFYSLFTNCSSLLKLLLWLLVSSKAENNAKCYSPVVQWEPQKVNEKIITDPIKIREQERSFYENLYSDKQEVFDDEIELYLQDLDMPKITEELKELCDSEITEEEISICCVCVFRLCSYQVLLSFIFTLYPLINIAWFSMISCIWNKRKLWKRLKWSAVANVKCSSSTKRSLTVTKPGRSPGFVRTA